MAENDTDSEDTKTEDPSQKKLDDAIKGGQVVNSKEVTSFLMLLSITVVIIWVMPYIVESMLYKLRSIVENAATTKIHPYGIGGALVDVVYKIVAYTSPIFLVVVTVAIFSSYIQQGEFVFSGKPIQPSLSKISIIKGFSRLFSTKNFVEFIKNLLKLMVVAIIVTVVIVNDIKELNQYQKLSVYGILMQLQYMAYHILIAMTLIMAVIAGADFAFQKYQHFMNLKMTKQEVKEEYKQLEGNPEIKRRVRSMRYEQSQKRIQQIIPKSTVIITNPEHYAIALEYDPETMPAPICVAKGTDLIAQKIKEIAKEHDVPIVESPPLARALYKDVDIDETIPVEHFEAVARVISYVMSLKK
jgi:flagellar biosynthetic protein FlhB